MQTVREGNSLTLTLSYEVGGLLVPPPTQSFKVKLYDHMGALMQELDVINPAEPEVIIPASEHTISSGRLFEKRTVLWGFNSPVGWQDRRIVYQIFPVQNFSVTAKDVQAFTGLSETELPEADLNLDQSYLKLTSIIPKDTLDAALTSGTISEVYANELIKLRTVIDVYPSLMQRMKHTEVDGVLEVRKQLIKNLEHILIAAKGRYDELIVLLVPEEAVASVPIFQIVRGTDPFTGT